MLRFAYNTNGLAHHRLEDAFALLADLGYAGVALTLDVGQLDPLRATVADVERVRGQAERRGLALTVETGARFVLDARRKHFPTLMEEAAEERRRRVDFLARAIDIAQGLGAPVVSLWAGVAPGGVVGDAVGDARPDRDGDGAARLDALWQRLLDGVRAVLEHAERRGVRVAFEPEPGMFVERPAGYLELVRRLGTDGDALGLCLDVGHLLVTDDRPEAAVVRELGAHLVHVHLDDAAGGRHEHLPFGRGELDLEGVLAALVDVGYAGLAAVELSRDSHRGADAAAEAMTALRAASPARR